VTRPKPVAVRRGSGPVHLASPVSERRLVAVCGAKFGLASVVPVREWQRRGARCCPECLEAAVHAKTLRILAVIAGW
jgi:hypothetical protein